MYLFVEYYVSGRTHAVSPWRFEGARTVHPELQTASELASDDPEWVPSREICQMVMVREA